MKATILILMAALLASPVFAQEAKKDCDNFFTCAISDVFDKVNSYTSGEKDILIPEDKWADEEEVEYGIDPTGRRTPKSTSRSGRSLSN